MDLGTAGTAAGQSMVASARTRHATLACCQTTFLMAWSDGVTSGCSPTAALVVVVVAGVMVVAAATVRWHACVRVCVCACARARVCVFPCGCLPVCLCVCF